ncbi:FadR/GntR family transcriptional regulator [Ideonella livida]|uniref:FadR family transcriptional regulator n=1 Tax=Ideonella livida TaxID=2707176 RepID=A0A7C9PF17_9BURK|nr:FadR/GntR family transcriptional regulator [Ideonella livida]NDY90297.1 FadR family transcriptional regulator [Ideonella livida]
MTSTPLLPRSLAHGLVDALQEEMRSGALRPGDKLPTEPLLMARFGVSRTVVREAMLRLQTAGWVHTRHGVGTFVCEPANPEPVNLGSGGEPPSLEDKLAMLELRMGLESDAAALAAQRRSPQQLEELGQVLASFSEAVAAGRPTVAQDAQFHLLVARATGNRHFEAVLHALGRATIQRLPPVVPDAPAAARAARQVDRPPSAPAAPRAADEPGLRPGKVVVLDEHRAIHDAIRRADAQAARAAMFLHLDQSRQRLRALAGLA